MPGRSVYVMTSSAAGHRNSDSPDSGRTKDWCDSGAVAITGPASGPVKIPNGSAATWAQQAASVLNTVPGTAGTLDGAALLAERAAFTGWTRRGKTSLGGYARLLPTADGWAAISSARPDDPALLGALVGSSNDGDPWPSLERWLSSRTRAEIDERLDLLGIAGGYIAAEPTASTPFPTSVRSVEGAVVIDFSALWAGPLCAQLLGSAGAHVIKFETPQRPDGARFGHRGFYDLLHGGHESVVLDPSVATERESLRRLVDSADIVIEASRPAALARFGLDAERYASRGTTWLSITAYGRSSNRIGFGDDVAAACGLVAEDSDGTPLFAGDAIADPLTGLRAAVCAVDAVNEGRGKVWDISMAETVSSTLGDGHDARMPQWCECESVRTPRHREVTRDSHPSGVDTGAVLERIDTRKVIL